MNYSMMFKKNVLFVLLILLFLSKPVCANAENEGTLPHGEVLIVYSDGAKESTVENVYRIVEMLTYEGVQVTFAPASKCVGQLSGFERIIFYELDDYPPELPGEIALLEKEAGEQKLLFAGNHFLKLYLDKTLRNNAYMLCDLKAGTLTYDFSGQERKQSLVAFEELLLLNGEHEYEAGFLSAGVKEGYFCARWGVITHITVTDLSNPLTLAAFSKELSLWRKGDMETAEYAQYIVLDRIYPFQNPDKLFQIIAKMAETHTPFVISAMPVYDHGDYPAMQHFCEVLRYAQDNGGVVILHAPVNQMDPFDVDLVNESIALAVNAYIQQGVYPMGLEVPHNWMSNSSAAEVMSRFKTILISSESDDRIEADWNEAQSNLVYRDDHQFIAPAIALDDDGVSYVNSCSSAVYLDMNESTDQIMEKIEACGSSFVPVKNLWEISHSLYTNTDTISCKNGKIYINGGQTDKTFIPTEYEENFSYNRNQLQRFSMDLTSENHKLIVAVAAVAVLFVIFIIVARRNNRSRFFFEDEEEDMDEYWENKG